MRESVRLFDRVGLLAAVVYLPDGAKPQVIVWREVPYIICGAGEYGEASVYFAYDVLEAKRHEPTKGAGVAE